MITVHRSMPNRKTLGTRFNLKPATRPVEVLRLQIGDVVVLEPEYPTVVTKMHRAGAIRLWGRYIWESSHAQQWPLGDFRPADRVPQAAPGEYPSLTR